MALERTAKKLDLAWPRGALDRARVTHLLRTNATVVAFVVLFVVLSIASPVFLTKTNMLNLLEQNAAVGIIACAGTLVIIAGGFDLSVGAIFAIAGVVGAKVANASDPMLGILAAIATGTALGVGNGLLVTVGRINSFIGTLATSYVIRGLALIISSGMLITVADASFAKLGSEGVLGIKYSIWA